MSSGWVRIAAFVVGLSIVPALPSSVWAQPEGEVAGESEAAPTAEEEEARHVFEFGLRAYEQGRYEDAARYFERSFELSGRGELQFNIGSSYEHAGRREQAATAFERFLEAEPDSDRRSEVEARIRALRGPTTPAGGGGESGGSAGDGEDDDTGGGGPGVGPFIVLGAGVAAAVAGAVFLGLAASAKSTVESAPRDTPWYMVEGDAANAETFGLVGAILIGVGAAAAAGGLVWLIAGGGSDEEEPAASVTVTPVGVSVRGAF